MGLHLAQVPLDLSLTNARVTIVSAREGRVALDPPRTKVAIYGAGYGKEAAPLNDPTWEVWALNAVAPIDREGKLRADRWFELHTRPPQSVLDMNWIQRCPMPLYLPPTWADTIFNERELMRQRKIDAMEDVPTAIRFPLERVMECFGGQSYFTCTFAYQIALALMEEYQEIGLFGVELAYGTERERTVEWACVSYWLGVARGLGVRVWLPSGSRLLHHKYLYGLEYDEEKAYVEDYLALMETGDKARREGMGG